MNTSWDRTLSSICFRLNLVIETCTTTLFFLQWSIFICHLSPCEELQLASLAAPSCLQWSWIRSRSRAWGGMLAQMFSWKSIPQEKLVWGWGGKQERGAKKKKSSFQVSSILRVTPRVPRGSDITEVVLGEKRFHTPDSHWPSASSESVSTQTGVSGWSSAPQPRGAPPERCRCESLAANIVGAGDKCTSPVRDLSGAPASSAIAGILWLMQEEGQL